MMGDSDDDAIFDEPAAALSRHSGGGEASEPTPEDDQAARRRRIREIMADPGLSQQEKGRAVQALMDGRRRSSLSSQISSQNSFLSDDSSSHQQQQQYVTLMARAAAQAHEYFTSDDDNDENDVFMGDAATPEDVRAAYGYERTDDARSVASSVTHASLQSGAAAAAAPNTGTGGIPRGMTYRQVHGRSFSLPDWTDLDRAAVAASAAAFGSPAQVSRVMELSRPECPHYERNCTVVSPCCGLAFGCRICHDEYPVLPKPLHLRHAESRGDGAPNRLAGPMGDLKAPSKSKMDRRRSMPIDLEEEDENHHPIDRFMIKEVICRSCYTRQSSKTNHCCSCGIQFGEYHCRICNLWMSAREAPYHCSDCGFCRVGGREYFRHCDDCGMCIDTLLFEEHNCKVGKYMSNCPVCQEDLFSSRYASHEMPCGHAIHWHCFKELTSYDTRCPVCKKTAETPEHMASTWSAIAMGIAIQPVPTEMARVVNIFCNDCEQSDANRRWHFLGVRCRTCMSFNTNVEQIVLQGREAADFLEELDSSRTYESNPRVPDNIAISSESGHTGVSADEGEAMEEDMPSAEFSSGSTGAGNHAL